MIYVRCQDKVGTQKSLYFKISHNSFASCDLWNKPNLSPGPHSYNHESTLAGRWNGEQYPIRALCMKDPPTEKNTKLKNTLAFKT